MIGANASRRAILDQQDAHRPAAVLGTASRTVHNETEISDCKFGLRGEVLGRADMPMLLPAWEDLCGRSAEDNVYYSPRYARALLESIDSDKDVRFAVVWEKERLLALLPFTLTTFRIPLLRPAARAWETKYTYSCMPVLDRTRKTEAAAALLDVLASISKGEWFVPTVNTKGEACQAMIEALESSGVPWDFSNRFSRAVLEAGGTFEEHLKRYVQPNRRKSLARNRRRLEELGDVEHESHCFGQGLDRAVATFLKIEAGGWKGKRGTALACNERTRKFAKNAFTGEEASSICRADMLTLNGMPIAVSLIALAGSTGFAVKAAYDESYRRYSPGLLLELEVIGSFLSESWAQRLDGATAGAHALDDLWSGRNEVADLTFSLSRRSPALRLSVLQITLKATRKVKAGLSWVIGRLRHS